MKSVSQQKRTAHPYNPHPPLHFISLPHMTSLSNQGLNSLTTIIKRLEAATSRLEDLSVASASQLQSSTARIGETIGPHVAPLQAQAAPASTTSTAPAPTASAAATEEVSASVKAFDEWIETSLRPYVVASDQIGGLVQEQATLVESLFVAQRSFIILASKCAKPAEAKLPGLLAEMVALLGKISAVKDTNRRAKEYNALSTVSEGVPAAGWVALGEKPGPFVGDMKESANFYGNRVIKEFKDTDKAQVEWVRSFIGALEDLRKYIMQHHATGLTWNPKGQDAVTYFSNASTETATPAASAPATPAPSGDAAQPAPPKGLFSELGPDVTKGLKKVDKSEMTHKNPELRASSVVPETGAPLKRPARPTKPPSLVGKKPAKTELKGNKWEIEYHENNSEIVLDNVEINQVVNIYNCKNSVIQIKGKVNAINLISSSKTSILLDSVVSSLSITSSPSFTIQILGNTPTITVDSTDSGNLYLSKDCIDGKTEIITAKSSAINVSLPDPDTDEQGVFVERAVPEQLKTVVKGGKLETTIVEHSG